MNERLLRPVPDPGDCPTCGRDACEEHATSGLVAYTFDELAAARLPRRVSLVNSGQDAIMREGDMVMLYGMRGIAKSWFSLAVALGMASGRPLLRGWTVPEPRKVVFVDGEMPGETIRSRSMELAEGLGVQRCPNLTIVAADWQREFLPRLDTRDGREAIEPFITSETACVFLDNASTLFDSEAESSPEAWAPAQAWLLSLRRRGVASWLVHHASRLGNARGHSKREDVMSLILKLTRPEDYTPDQGARVRVEFDKARGFYGIAASPFVAALDAGTWRVEEAAEVGRDSDLKQRIIAFVTANPGSTKNAICREVTGQSQRVRAAVDQLGDAGLLQLSGSKWRLA